MIFMPHSRKAIPIFLLASPASTQAYETKISGLKTIISDVRQSKQKLQEKHVCLQLYVHQLQESNLELKESNKLLTMKLATAKCAILTSRWR
jgi:hypothetical protein